jgi:hypothetical protein
MGFLKSTHLTERVNKRRGSIDDPVSIRRMKFTLDRRTKFRPVPTKAKVDFRASGLPYCPIYNLSNIKKNKVYIPEVGKSWFDTFFTAIGTVVHERWQDIYTRAAEDPKIPMKVRPFGAWVCSHCYKKLEPSFLPKHICDCNNDQDYTLKEFLSLRRKQHHISNDEGLEPYYKQYEELGPTQHWLYVEVGFKYKGLSGHVDYIEYYPNEDRWVVYDLKTATLAAVKGEDKTLPVVKNIYQIESYCVILPKVFKQITHISEYMLLYQARDSALQQFPYVAEWTQDREARATKRLNRYIKGHDFVVEYLQEKTHNPEIMADIVGSRPCYSEKSYMREMHTAFLDDETQSKCKYKHLCTTCEGSKLAKKLYSVISDELEELEK